MTIHGSTGLSQLRQLFDEQSDQFVQQFAEQQDSEILAAVIDTWLADDRPWSRQQLLAYTETVLYCRGHEAAFRRLFGHAEAVHDHEILSRLLVELDRCVRRERITRLTRAEGTARTEEVLRARSGRLVPHAHPDTSPVPQPDDRLFTQTTRSYFRRRVWRYFRRLSVTDPPACTVALARALKRFQDDDFAAGENIIDNWSLMHACFRHSPVLTFDPVHTQVTAGHTLNNLEPAPWKPEIWRSASAQQVLFDVAANADSAFVRRWSVELLTQQHADDGFAAEPNALQRLLCHHDPVVLTFAVDVLQHHPQPEVMDGSLWMVIFELASPAILPAISKCFIEFADPQKIHSSQLISLAQSCHSDVARAGFRVLQARHRHTGLTTEELTRLAECQCAAHACEIAAWAMSELNSKEPADVMPFLAAALPGVRRAAMDRLSDCPAFDEDCCSSWLAIAESPHRDVQWWLMDVARTHTHSAVPDSRLVPIFRRAVLETRFGNRYRAWALNQLARILTADKDQADSVLPIVAVALRSLRHTDRRAALGALARAGHQAPELKAAIGRHIPELLWENGSGVPR